ncbi:hypothetical protein JR334_06705 [Clostridia bacterium]|nr:hypothetical protein JR334_06705 [Clostridia bacterium]
MKYEENNILRKAFDEAAPYLEKRYVQDLRIGLNIVGVELDNGELGSSYVLREELSGCLDGIFSNNLTLLGMDALQMGHWATEKIHILKRALGIAALNTGARAYLEEKNLMENLDVFSLVRPDDTIGMVGYLGPVVKRVRKEGLTLHAFDKGHAGQPGVEPVEDMLSTLPRCSVVFLSGTTLINNSLGELLEVCTKAREVILIGSTTLPYLEAYRDTKISVIAGTLWDKNLAGDFKKIISMAGGIPSLRLCSSKFAYRNPNRS